MPSPILISGVKCYALCPWFADTPLLRQTATPELVRKKSKTRCLTVQEVGVAFDRALDLDVNGGVFGIFPDAPHPVSNPAEFDPAFQAYTFHSTLPYFWLLTRDHKTVAQSLFGCLDKVFVKKIEGGSGAGVNRTGAISTTVPQAARSMSQRNAMNPTETRKVTRAKGGKNGILRPQRRSEAD